MHAEHGDFCWTRKTSSHYLQEKEGWPEMLISSMEKCLGALILPFPTIADTLQSGVPKAKLPQTDPKICPKRILTPSISDKQFCPLRWTRRSVKHFDCELSG